MKKKTQIKVRNKSYRKKNKNKTNQTNKQRKKTGNKKNKQLLTYIYLTSLT